MTKENTPATAGTETGNSIQVNGALDINMSEIVSVGVARMEKQLGSRLKDLRVSLRTCRNKVTEYTEKLQEECRHTAPQHFSELHEIIKQKFDNVKTKELSTSDRESEVNTHTFSLQSPHHHGFLTIEKVKVPFTDEQHRILRNIDTYNDDITTLQEQIVELKRKMADIPKMERQMKARVVESQLNKSEDGRELLEKALEGFDMDLELLG